MLRHCRHSPRNQPYTLAVATSEAKRFEHAGEAEMHASWYERKRPAADMLVVGELPTPEPGPGEVHVHLRTSRINPGDTKMRTRARDVKHGVQTASPILHAREALRPHRADQPGRLLPRLIELTRMRGERGR